MVYCCVPWCKSGKGNPIGVSFHEFPSNVEQRRKWLTAIYNGEKERLCWTPSSLSLVCSKHFIADNFSRSTSRKRLLPNVVPTIFEGVLFQASKKPPSGSPQLEARVNLQPTGQTNEIGIQQSKIPSLEDTKEPTDKYQYFINIIARQRATIYQLRKKIDSLQASLDEKNKECSLIIQNQCCQHPTDDVRCQYELTSENNKMQCVLIAGNQSGTDSNAEIEADAAVVRPEPAIKVEPPDLETGAAVCPNYPDPGFEFVSVATEEVQDHRSPKELSPFQLAPVKEEPENRPETEPIDPVTNSTLEHGKDSQVDGENCIRPIHSGPGDEMPLHIPVCSERLGGREQSGPQDAATTPEGVQGVDIHVNVRLTVDGDQVYQCGLCGVSFERTKQLVKHHLRTHSPLKPLQCRICQKKFSQSSNLLRHERIHTGEKPFRCRSCPKEFNDPSHLIRHDKTHTRAVPHRCGMCDRPFLRKCDLVTHLKGHSGEKMYRCNVCQREFTQSSNLVRHRVVHTGEKPYECKLCHKQYNDRSHLARHSHIHIAKSRCDILRKHPTDSGRHRHTARESHAMS